MLRWLWLSLLVIVLDQASKLWFESNFMLYEVVKVLPFFNLTLTYNHGAAFSMLSDQSGWQRWFLSAVSTGVTIVLLLWLRNMKRREIHTALALSLIIGGAVGNLIDRLWSGRVIDFLDFYIGQYHWPAFNVADSAITLGVVVMIYELLFAGGNNSKA